MFDDNKRHAFYLRTFTGFRRATAIMSARVDMVEIREGNILAATEKYICHQCNTKSWFAKGLAKRIFDRFPEANVYAGSREPKMLGRNIIRQCRGENGPRVVNMFAQHHPGEPRVKGDDAVAREGYFKACLQELAAQDDLEGVAFPWGIGCGLAGGDWEKYLNMIHEFAASTNARVVVYKLPPL